MVRVTGFVTLALALIWAAAAMLIRAELMAPGVDVLGDPDTANAGSRYNMVVTLHGVGGTLFSIALGLWLGALAAARGARAALIWVWPGLVLLALLIAAILLVTVLSSQPSSAGVGWTLDPPLSTEAGPGAIVPETLPFDARLVLVLPTTIAQAAWAYAFVILGGISLAVTTLDSRALRLTFIGAALIYALGWGGYAYVRTALWNGRAFAFGYDSLLSGSLLAMIAATVLLTLSLIALPRLAAAAYLVAGAVFSVVVQQDLRLVTIGIDRAYHDIYYVVAYDHILLSLLAIFAGFAALSAALKVRLPSWALALHAGLLALALLATFLPQSILGLRGMPRRYIDYPEVFAYWNRVSSIGARVFAALALTGIALIWARRTRA